MVESNIYVVYFSPAARSEWYIEITEIQSFKTTVPLAQSGML
jgi:hypothetical protein